MIAGGGIAGSHKNPERSASCCSGEIASALSSGFSMHEDACTRTGAIRRTFAPNPRSLRNLSIILDHQSAGKGSRSARRSREPFNAVFNTFFTLNAHLISALHCKLLEFCTNFCSSIAFTFQHPIILIARRLMGARLPLSSLWPGWPEREREREPRRTGALPQDLRESITSIIFFARKLFSQ